MRKLSGTHIAFGFTALMLLSVLSGCGGTPHPFTLMDDGYKIKHGSLAVISGDNTEPTFKVAENITRELKQRSTFKVMSQEEISRRLAKYPVNIKHGTPKDEDKPLWLSPGEKNRIDTIQAELKTDQVLVVWVTGLTRRTVQYSNGGGEVSYWVGVIGNMFEYPRSKAVGFIDFGTSKKQSCCLLGKSEGADIEELFKQAAERIAEKFMTVTGSEKPVK